MRVSAIQWSKLFIVVLPTHKYMYTSSTTTLQLCLLGPLGMHYQFSHFNNRGQWYSKVTNKIFTVVSSAVTNSGAVIKSGRQLIQSLQQSMESIWSQSSDLIVTQFNLTFLADDDDVANCFYLEFARTKKSKMNSQVILGVHSLLHLLIFSFPGKNV